MGDHRSLVPSDNTTVVVVALASGVVSPSVVAILGARARRGDLKRAEREHQLKIATDALDAVSRERQLLYVGWNLWRHELNARAPEVVEHDKTVAEAIERVWMAENTLRVRFGSDAAIYTAFSEVIEKLDVMLKVEQRHVVAPGPPTLKDLADFQRASSDVAGEQKRYVEAVRTETTHESLWAKLTR